MDHQRGIHSIDFREINLKRGFPNLTKPTVCGFFSIDGERRYIPDAINLMYLYGPIPTSSKKVSFDLNQGYHQTIPRPRLLQETEKINHLLEYLMRVPIQKFEENSKLFDFDFVCFRGLLTKIMCTPYERKVDWSICASYLQGNIYLCDLMTPETRNQQLNEPEKLTRCSSWGYKFEQYLLTDDPKKSPDTTPPVNQSEEFGCIFEAKLDNIKLIYGAEMDGLLSSEKLDPVTVSNLNEHKFIELKTNREFSNLNQQNNTVRFKYIKWWCQCFMVGISDILVGFRDDRGKVLAIKPLKVRDLPKTATDFWKAHVCLYFLSEFLQFVQNVILNDPDLVDDARTVWKFDWKPPELDIRYQKYSGASDYTFIPDWYISHVEKVRNKRF